MLIGIPKEIKNNENRVGLTPAGVQSLVKKGHHVLVETNAGLGSGFADEDYAKQGATIVATAAEAWAAEMVSKSKNPSLKNMASFAKTSCSSPTCTWLLLLN